MKDPHVVSLTYKIIEGEGFKFKDPKDVQIDTPVFKGSLSKGILTLQPKEHFESEAQVRLLADDYVRGWEIDAALKSGQPEFHFRFEGSQIEDRQAAPATAHVHSSIHAHVSTTAMATKVSSDYPTPPVYFQLSPEVEVLWNRYTRYLESREPLLSMSYYCLSFLEGNEKNKRKKAEQRYGIDLSILDKLGDLTTNRGDNTTARKASKTTIPLSVSESAWIKAAIKALIKHLATRQSGQKLTMADLPPLT